MLDFCPNASVYFEYEHVDQCFPNIVLKCQVKQKIAKLVGAWQLLVLPFAAFKVRNGAADVENRRYLGQSQNEKNEQGSFEIVGTYTRYVQNAPSW